MRHRFLAAFLAAFLASGCATVTVSTGSAVVGEPLEDTAWVLLWGLMGDNVNVPAHNGAARVRVYHSFGGFLVSVLTAGLVQPMTVEVWPVLGDDRPPR